MAYAVRWDQAVYTALKSEAERTKTSMNFIANAVVADYLLGGNSLPVLPPPELPEPDKDKLEAVIRRLSGEDT